jgi:hypothetical protein
MFFYDFYAEKNFMFKREEIVDPFWEIFMAHEWETMHNSRVKLKFSESVAKSFQVDHHSLVDVGRNLLIFFMKTKK